MEEIQCAPRLSDSPLPIFVRVKQREKLDTRVQCSLLPSPDINVACSAEESIVILVDNKYSYILVCGSVKKKIQQ